MLRKLVIPLLLFAFLLAACGGEAQTPEVEASVQEESPTSDGAEPSADTESSETTEESNTEQEEQPAPTEVAIAEFVSECALSDTLAEGPTELEKLFAVRDTDWVIGSEDAAITLVEYGDFQ